jgi:hypothetical protein
MYRQTVITSSVQLNSIPRDSTDEDTLIPQTLLITYLAT